MGNEVLYRSFEVLARGMAGTLLTMLLLTGLTLLLRSYPGRPERGDDDGP
ncbi:MAG: hypothetical protein HPY55_06430 [Firmicutes bacterium]|nr:hypothetical protein [Bacillota bacterium]